jgi:hypothetical protein
MNAELAVKEEQRSLLQTILEVSRETGVDVAEKMRVLYELKKTIDADVARAAFNQAMIACQREMQPIARTVWNDQTKSHYAKYEHVEKAIRPTYQRHGFGFTWTAPTSEGNKVLVAGKLLHEAGHAEPYELAGPIDMLGIKGNPNKTEMHGLTSSVSYLRRVLTSMAFNLVFEDQDKDGNKEIAKITKEQVFQLCDLAEQGKVTEKMICEQMKITKLEDLPAARFTQAHEMLKARIRILEGKK